MSEISPNRLRSLFQPRSIALVGASDKSMFSRIAFNNLVEFGFGEHTHLINPRNDIVHGKPTVPNIQEVDEAVDVAFLMVPQQVTLSALSEAAKAGVKNAVILSSGYGEAGNEGREAEAELVAHARDLGMVLLGPNHLGFANFVDQIPVTSIPNLPEKSGNIALLSQSGASSSAMLDFASMSGNDLSYMVTLGNEAMITAGHALEFFVEDPNTKSIAIFMETIREPEVFTRAAMKALEVGKAVVILKAGSSELAARTAEAHTGALVGDDKTIDAMFRDLGVIRVDTIEDMLVTAGLARYTGPLGPGGLGVVSISGGACDIIADRAQDAGLELSQINSETRNRLSEVMPDYGTIQNPLDVTGAAVIDPAIFTESVIALDQDPGISATTVVMGMPWEGEGEYHSQYLLNAIGEGAKVAKKPVVLLNQILQPITPYTLKVLDEANIGLAMGGIGQGINAFAGIVQWSERRRWHLGQQKAQIRAPRIQLQGSRSGAWSEHAARTFIEQAGIPVAPSTLAISEDNAVKAALSYKGHVAMKIVSPDILHKSDIGGVALNIDGEAEVRRAYQQIMKASENVPNARIEGVLISPMRSGGVELLVGAVRDPQWGHILAIALGGVFVEIFEDSVLTQVPVEPERVKQLIATLKSAPLLQGARGNTPADMDRLAAVISRVGDLVYALGDDLESLEINPLRVDGENVEALDAVITWASNE